MELWFVIILTICISAIIRSFLLFFWSTKQNLPPGPPDIPLVSSISWLRRSLFDILSILLPLFPKYGPIVSLRVGLRRAIFVASPSLAHEALVQNSAVFADRPPPLPVTRIMNGGKTNINSSAYGPTWRSLRRNLTSQILHPSHLYSYAHARFRALHILIDRLQTTSQSGEAVKVRDHVRYAMYWLFISICFGEELPAQKIEEIIALQRKILLNIRRFNVFNFLPVLGKFLFRRRWKELLQLRRSRQDVFFPIIRERIDRLAEISREVSGSPVCYLDSLISLYLPKENRNLDEGEIMNLCSEFLVAGTDTTSTAMEWIIANFTKNPRIQESILREIRDVMKENNTEKVEEKDLRNLRYLKATILEALRRHPPARLLLPHAVTKEAMLGGYTVPKNASINFVVSEIGMDPKVWNDPTEFRPERFLAGNGDGDLFDLTGSREIQMIPFGAGRRICPGFALAMLHLEFFVANLILKFQWQADEDVDLSDKLEFTNVMAHPLQAQLLQRAGFNSKA